MCEQCVRSESEEKCAHDQEALNKSINTYVYIYIATLKDQTVPPPIRGACFDCFFFKFSVVVVRY